MTLSRRLWKIASFWQTSRKAAAPKRRNGLRLANSIKILNDDDALELFKKTVPSASLLQVRASSKGGVKNALHELSKVKSRHFFGVDLIALALKGKKVNFDKVIKMIDDMVELLKTEQQDDDHKKEYCTAQFDY